jgi:hypothetical protein
MITSGSAEYTIQHEDRLGAVMPNLRIVPRGGAVAKSDGSCRCRGTRGIAWTLGFVDSFQGGSEIVSRNPRILLGNTRFLFSKILDFEDMTGVLDFRQKAMPLSLISACCFARRTFPPFHLHNYYLARTDYLSAAHHHPTAAS